MFGMKDPFTKDTSSYNIRPNLMVPLKGIIMWSEPLADIPDNFVLCDGSTHTLPDKTTVVTPDMRGIFPRGAAAGIDPGATGGSNTDKTLGITEVPSNAHGLNSHTHTGPSHTHTGPSHTHAIGDSGEHQHKYAGAGVCANWAGMVNNTYDTMTSTAMGGDHDHGGATGSAGTGATGSGGTGATGAASGDTATAGGGTPFSMLPAFQGLAFIMRIK
jgi:hypothetical protein